jgi:hypothetical protein
VKGNTLKRKGITFLFLLIFFQQMGAGLFVHNLVHEGRAGHSPIEKKEGGKEINFACRCVDDFLMPFVASDEPTVSQTPIIYAKAVDAYTESIYFTSLIIASLRGPPVFIN